MTVTKGSHLPFLRASGCIRSALHALGWDEGSSAEKGPITPYSLRQCGLESFTFYGTGVTKWAFYKGYGDLCDFGLLGRPGAGDGPPSIGTGRFARCEEEWEDWAIALPVAFRYNKVSDGFGASDRCRPSDRTLDAMHLAEDGWKERAVKVALPSQIRGWNHAVWISVVLVLFSSRVWVAGEARYPIQRGKRSCDPRRNGRARRACPTATSQRSTWSNDRVWRVHRFDTR